MHVLFLTSNPEFLEEGGKEQKFLDGLVSAAETLHIVVLAGRGQQVKKLNDHTWVYPVHSFFGFKAFSMMRVARFQMSWQKEFRAHIIYSDDVHASGWAGAWLAFWYDKVWVVNVRSYEWGTRAMRRRPFSFLSTMPLSLVLSLAHKICIFSDLTRLYLSVTAAHREDKIVVFPRLYDTETFEKDLPLVDMKARYPAINFSLLVASTLNYHKRLSLALSIIALLRKNQYYTKAGLIVVGLGGSQMWWRARAWLRGLGRWVHFENPQMLNSALKSTNLFLHLASGEENEDAFIRAAVAYSPIIAVDTKITHMLIKDGVNGIIVHEPTAEAFVQAIVKMNKSSEREIFRVNSSLYAAQTMVASKQEIVAALQALWEYQEAPPVIEEMPPLDPHPITPPPPTRWEKFKEILKEMFPSKDPGLEVSNKFD